MTNIFEWETFEIELCRRLGKLTEVDIVEEFNKLIQEDTVLQYQENFEEMRFYN